MTDSCEIGATTKAQPLSGKVVSPIFVITPIGFRPSHPQCPKAGATSNAGADGERPGDLVSSWGLT